MQPFLVRKAIPNDIPFIYATWLNAIKNDSALGLSTTKTLFYESYRLVLDYILSHNATVLVACKTDEPNVIYGFLVSEDNKLHFCFVKEHFRKLGIARSLFEHSFGKGSPTIYCTHKTKFVEELLRDRSWLVYNPYLLYQINLGENNE